MGCFGHAGTKGNLSTLRRFAVMTMPRVEEPEALCLASDAALFWMSGIYAEEIGQ